jgi:NADPH:quinone reductase-like Zn-dependent oxidoreductase
VAGSVVQPAANGFGPPVGSRVVGHPPHGGWAQLAAVPADALAALPDHVSFEQAAALPLAGLTALRLLRDAGPVNGLRVLITGASGGVGHYVTEMASAAGAEVTVMTATPQRADRLLALGAAHVVHNIDHARAPFDVVLESVGGDVLPRAFALLRQHGRLVWFGQASRRPIELDFFECFAQTGATIRHFHYEASDLPVGRDLETLVRLVAAGRLHPEIGVVADWGETPAVIRDLRERRVRGNAVLTIPDEQEVPDG